MSTNLKHIPGIVSTLKSSIISAQYRAVKMVNRELLQLYYYVGAVLTVEAKKAKWGEKILEVISRQLQQELPGLRGFSAQNLKKMKLFYEAYPFDEIGSALLNQFKDETSTTLAIRKTVVHTSASATSSALLNQLTQHFWEVGFTAHYSIISKSETLEQRVFYLVQSVQNGWSTRVLENHLKNKLFDQQGNLPTNFQKTLDSSHHQALNQFRDEYLLDFISLQDADDERLIEQKIVNNITRFILNLGKGFSFVGNQYALKVDNKEFFIDLLFFNRELQALIAIELKRGEFKPEFAGQLNFYLSVLDEKVRLPHEKPTIGIILCKEKNNVVVEYALRGLDKPMGVATFKTKDEIPELYQKILPGVEELRQLMKEEE